MAKAAVGKMVRAERTKAWIVGLGVALALGVASAAGVGMGLDGMAVGDTEELAPVRPVSLQQSDGGGPVGSGADSRPSSLGSERVSGERQSGGGSSGSDADSRSPTLY